MDDGLPGDERLLGHALDGRLVFDAMLEVAAFHELVLDPDGRPADYRLLDVNAAYTRVLGIPRESAVGRLASEVYCTAPAPYLEEYARCALGGAPERFETFFAPMDRHFSISVVSPARGFFFTITQDVTDHRRADARLAAERERLASALAALRESEERYRGLVQSSPDGVVVHSQGGVVFANPAAVALLRARSEEELVGLPPYELIDPAWHATARQRIAAVERGETAPAIEYRLVRRDGTLLEAELISVPVRYHGVPSVLVILRDISARKRAEADRKRLAEQLAAAQRLESVGRLAGGVAHDFNNIVTVILSCAEAVRGDLRAGGTVDLEDVEEIASAGQRARDLTRQLLAFAGRQAIAAVPLDLNAVVRGAERMVRRVLREDIALELELGRDLWTVASDAGQLEQVILNLALNARDAMPSGGRLTLLTSNETVGDGHSGGPGDFVRLLVRDTGVGMSDAVKQHLFEPFFTTKPRGEGTGLGLASVYGIVSQSGGHVHVESAPGAGTTFEIYLPRVG